LEQANFELISRRKQGGLGDKRVSRGCVEGDFNTEVTEDKSTEFTEKNKERASLESD